jgi:hypothetical protein
MCSENLPYSSLQIKEMLSDPNYVNLGLIKNNKLVAYLITNISDQIDII